MISSAKLATLGRNYAGHDIVAANDMSNKQALCPLCGGWFGCAARPFSLISPISISPRDVSKASCGSGITSRYDLEISLYTHHKSRIRLLQSCCHKKTWIERTNNVTLEPVGDDVDTKTCTGLLFQHQPPCLQSFQD